MFWHNTTFEHVNNTFRADKAGFNRIILHLELEDKAMFQNNRNAFDLFKITYLEDNAVFNRIRLHLKHVNITFQEDHGVFPYNITAFLTCRYRISRG